MNAKLTSEKQARLNYLLYECESTKSFAKTLEQVESSNEIDEFVNQYNWDFGSEPLKLVLQNPLCDRGTALKIYWLVKPDYYSGYLKIEDVPTSERDDYLFLKFIESLFKNKSSFRFNNIHFDPTDEYSVENWRSIVKYSEIPDELLLPNFGDNYENLQRLRKDRETPDDGKCLDFLVDKYLKGKDYIKALECSESLLKIDPESHRNCYLKISVLEKIETQYESNNSLFQEIAIPSYQDIHQVRKSLVDCYQNEINLYQENLKSSNPSKYAWDSLMEAKENIAQIYLRDKDYSKAIEILETIFEESKIKPSYRVKVNNITFELAKANQMLNNYDRALHYIDIFLEDIPEFEYLYFHKLDILRQMESWGEADILLEQILETIANTIEKNQNNNSPDSAFFDQQSTLLEEYKEDFQGAATSLQKIIDLGLYYGDENRKNELRQLPDAPLRESAGLSNPVLN